MLARTRSPSRLAEPDVLDDLLLYRLNRVQSQAGGIVLRHCEGRFGITRREWRILASLAARGPMSSSELAVYARLDRPRTSKAVTALAAKKLVSRASLAGDARHVVLSLTPQGDALYEELFPLVRRINQEVLGVLSPDELELFDGMLARLQARADAMAEQQGQPLADRRRGGSARVLARQ